MRGGTALEATADLVSVREASNATGIPRRTLYHWIRQGKVVAYQIGGVLFMHRDDVTALAMRDE